MNLGNRILAGILVLQLVVVAIVLWPRTPPAVGDEPLFAGIEADQISQVTIREADVEIRLIKRGKARPVGHAWSRPPADRRPDAR